MRADIKRVDTHNDGVVLKTAQQDIKADQTVIAAGAWSAKLATMLDARIGTWLPSGFITGE